MVVGDDDQTIYSWRGAKIENINNFKKKYPSVKIVKLEQNYRSTQNILSVANSIIQQNLARNEKELWSNISGNPVKLREYYCEEEEAEEVFKEIYNKVRDGKARYRDFVILYRSNFMSRVYEEAARMKGLPYKMLGAMKFYDRKEVKLALSYIKILVTEKDTLSYIRTLETPSRGIGAKSIKKIIDFSESRSITFFEALKRANEIETISPRIQNSILAYVKLINIGKDYFRNNTSWTDAFLNFSEKAGVFRYFEENAKNEKELQRMEGNYTELARSLDIFRNREQERGGENITLYNFLERVALISDSDGIDRNKDFITMMTIHTSKGLEYPEVYLVGLIDGNMPNKRALEESSVAIEEERRLMYVAVTRAQRELYLSYFSHRSTKNGDVEMIPSRFLNKLPEYAVDNTLSSLKKIEELVIRFLCKKQWQRC
jgi:DNA helicase-2/ATP-dependent DNA helicase PcrA